MTPALPRAALIGLPYRMKSFQPRMGRHGEDRGAFSISSYREDGGANLHCPSIRPSVPPRTGWRMVDGSDSLPCTLGSHRHCTKFDEDRRRTSPRGLQSDPSAGAGRCGRRNAFEPKSDAWIGYQSCLDGSVGLIHTAPTCESLQRALKFYD
jgi:hypothetical protein